MLSALPIAATLLLSVTAAPAPPREIESVAAFARLYGVVRFFYPSDAAAELDWNRFAVHGVSRVRAARDTADLGAALEKLVAPLGPGIVIGGRLAPPPPATTPGGPLVAWRYLGPGFSTMRGPYRAERTHRAPREPGDGFASLMRTALAWIRPAEVELFPEGAPTAGAHVDVELGSSLRARVPLALTDAQARLDPARKGDLDALHAALSSAPGPSEMPDADQRLADVVVAWSVFRHFYPYWVEAGVDWDRRLGPQLEAARAATSRAAQRDALKGLVADLRDGHGFVADTLDRAQRGDLPVRLAVIEGRLIVTASAVPSEAPVGAEVVTIAGVPATDRLARATTLVSGSPQWRQMTATWALTSGVKGATVELGLDRGSGPRPVTLTYGTAPPPVKRPQPVAQVEAGLWYVDLTRAKMPEVAPKLADVAAARGVVFDVRGYPTDAGFGILPHLLDAPETDRWMHVAKIVGPFYETAGWLDVGWDMKPANPRIAGKVVFLTDGGAISYAESVMGYVADRKLGTIVGTTTAGTNGNVASFPTPGGFDVGFTGMRVTRHDGHSPHHLVGVTPDVAVAPTLAGLRAGRDEVLERGLAIARAGASSP